MARVTIEDCIKTEGENRFKIILAASKRAHQLNKGYQPTVSIDGDKPTVIALREIAEGTQNVEDILAYEEQTDIVL